MEKPDLKTSDKQQLIAYIEYQDKILQGSSRLQMALAEMCDVLASDLMLINKGQTEGLKILNSDERYFERINLMVKNKSDWASLAIVQPEQETTASTVKKKPNIQNLASK